MRFSFAAPKTKWLGAGVLVLVCVAVFLGFLLSPETPAPVLVLHQPFKVPQPLRDQLLRIIPGAASSGWGWALGNALFGQRKPVNIYANIVALPEAVRRGVVSSLPVVDPVFSDPNGFAVWFLTDKDLQTVRQRFKQTPGIEFLDAPRISMADGIQASLFSGQLVPLNAVTNEVGLRVEYFTRVRGQAIDLFASLTLSEALTNHMDLNTALANDVVSIHTNLSLATRLQIPKGRGVLLVTHAPNDRTHRSFGVIIEPP